MPISHKVQLACWSSLIIILWLIVFRVLPIDLITGVVFIAFAFIGTIASMDISGKEGAHE